MVRDCRSCCTRPKVRNVCKITFMFQNWTINGCEFCPFWIFLLNNEWSKLLCFRKCSNSHLKKRIFTFLISMTNLKLEKLTFWPLLKKKLHFLTKHRLISDKVLKLKDKTIQRKLVKIESSFFSPYFSTWLNANNTLFCLVISFFLSFYFHLDFI